MVMGLVPTPGLATMVEQQPSAQTGALQLDAQAYDEGAQAEQAGEELPQDEVPQGEALPPSTDSQDEQTQTLLNEPANSETADDEGAGNAQTTDDLTLNDNQDPQSNEDSTEPEVTVNFDQNDITAGFYEARFADGNTIDYTGYPVVLPEVVITHLSQQEETLVEYEDFVFNHFTDHNGNKLDEAPTEPNNYYAVYVGINNYKGSRGIFFRIRGLDDLEHQAWEADFISGSVVGYTGSPVSAPNVDIYRWDDESGKTIYLTEGVDFKLDHYVDANGKELDQNPVEIGEYGAVYCGIYEKDGDYMGQKTVWFSVCDTSDIGSDYWESRFDGNFTLYSTGAPVTLNRLVICNESNKVSLRENVDFVLDHCETEDHAYYSAGTPSQGGRYYAVYKGIGTHTGTRSEFFEVVDAGDLSKGTIVLQNDRFSVNPTGLPVNVKESVRDGFGILLKKGQEYELVYYDSNKDELQWPPAKEGIYYVAARGIVNAGYMGTTGLVKLTIGDVQDPGQPFTPDPVAMALNIQCTAKVPGDSYWLGVFTAPQAGLYAFTSHGDYDTEAYLWGDKYLSAYLNHDDQNGEGDNFMLSQSLVKGQSVYLAVSGFSGEDFSCKVSVTKKDANDLSMGYVSLGALELDSEHLILAPYVYVFSPTRTILIEGTDYELVYERRVNGSFTTQSGAPTQAGTYKVYARAKAGSGYTGQTAAVQFDAYDAKDLCAQGELRLQDWLYNENVGYDYVPVYLFTGSAVTPPVTVEIGDNVLDSSNYTASYKNNAAEGMATVTVTGKGSFFGSLTKEFKLTSKLSLADYASSNGCTVKAFGEIHSYASSYSGPLQFLSNGWTISPQVVFDSVGLFSNAGTPMQGRDFEITFANEQGRVIPAPSMQGKYSLVLTATQYGNYAGAVSIPFSIVLNRDLSLGSTSSWMVTPDSTSYSIGSYDATAIPYQAYDQLDPESNVLFELFESARGLVQNLDYMLSCAYDSVLGFFVYTFTGIGSYEGVADAEYHVAVPTSLQESFDHRAAYTRFAKGNVVYVNAKGILVDPELTLEGLAYGLDYTFDGFTNEAGQSIATAAVGDNVNVVVRGLGTYAGCKRELTCTVQQGSGEASIEDDDAVLDIENAVRVRTNEGFVWYLLKSATPTVSVRIYGKYKLVLRDGEGLSVERSVVGNTMNLSMSTTDDAPATGTRQATVQLVESYNLATMVKRFTIADATGQITNYDTSSSGAVNLDYSGVAYMPEFGFVTTDLSCEPEATATLAKVTGGTVSKINGPGEYMLNLQGKGAWSGSIQIPLAVSQSSQKFDISACAITVGSDTQLVGGVSKPSVTLSCAGHTLREGSDYTLEYGNNSVQGERGWVRATAVKGSSFTGTRKANFTVGADTEKVLKITSFAIYLAEPSGNGSYNAAKEMRVYTLPYGATEGPAVTVMRKGMNGVTEPMDSKYYTVTYGNLNKEGRGYVQVTGKNGYTGSIGADFYVALPEPTSIKKAVVTLGATSYTYDGKRKTPGVRRVVLNGKTLVAGTDYEVTTPSGRIDAGTYTYVVTGIGAYKGTAKAAFVINKAANPMRLSATKTTVKVTYNPSKNVTTKSNVVVQNATGKVTFTNKTASPFTKKFTVTATTGAVTVAKGLPVGKYPVTIQASDPGSKNYEAGKKTVTYTISVTKAANPLTVTAVTRTVSASALKKKNVVVECPLKVSGAVGNVAYEKASGSKRLAVNKTTGKVTILKGTSKGTYKLSITVSAAGNANYASAAVTVSTKIVVK